MGREKHESVGNADDECGEKDADTDAAQKNARANGNSQRPVASLENEDGSSSRGDRGDERVPPWREVEGDAEGGKCGKISGREQSDRYDQQPTMTNRTNDLAALVLRLATGAI